MTLLDIRLASIEPAIDEICSISGVAGLSYGIIENGNRRHYGNFGFRDLEAKLLPDENTIYHIGSLTKKFTAAVVGCLVEDGKLSWTQPVSKILPELSTLSDQRTQKDANMIDLLSHRMGLAQKLDLCQQGCNKLLLSKDQTIPTFAYLEQVKPFRAEWGYNSWSFCIAGEVIERVTGHTYGTVLSDKILKPLCLDRTIIDPDGSSIENVAEPYVLLNDGSLFHIPRPPIADGTFMASSGGIRSSVKDLLTFYDCMLSTSEVQFGTRCTSSAGSPLKQVSTILSAHTPMPQSNIREKSYGLGCVRAELPNRLDDTGLNEIFLNEMPVLDLDAGNQLVIHHHGSLMGFTSAVFIFPESKISIVVLANSLGFNDCPDWVGQLLIQTIFKSKHQNNYIELARQSANAHRSIYAEIEEDLEKHRIPDTKPKKLSLYEGRFFNAIENFFLEITHSEGTLWMSFQGLMSEKYRLKHYHHDTFTWHLTRDEDMKRARFTVLSTKVYQITFAFKGETQANELIWAHEPDIPDGEVFKRRTLKSP